MAEDGGQRTRLRVSYAAAGGAGKKNTFLAVFLSLLCILSFPSASLGMVSLSNHFVAN